jgi:hypothetical protein
MNSPASAADKGSGIGAADSVAEGRRRERRVVVLDVAPRLAEVVECLTVWGETRSERWTTFLRRVLSVEQQA